MPHELDKTLLLKSIRRLARALDVHSRQINRDSGLTLPQLIVLQCVRDLGEVTGRAISEAADLSPPTVVGILDKLEGKGLIERYRSTRDRRVVHTRLSPGGRALLARSPSPLGPEFEAGFMALDPAERQKILAAFSKAAGLAFAPEGREDEPPAGLLL
jgi:DNA-binding MarR family transcriptional regulator